MLLMNYGIAGEIALTGFAGAHELLNREENSCFLNGDLKNPVGGCHLLNDTALSGILWLNTDVSKGLARVLFEGCERYKLISLCGTPSAG